MSKLVAFLLQELPLRRRKKYTETKKPEIVHIAIWFKYDVDKKLFTKIAKIVI